MTNVTAILSMLHEPPDRSSASRVFRGQPVLRWTIERITRSQRIGSIAVLCWEDQLADVTPIAEEERAYVMAKGPRTTLAEIESVAAARRWADGWRGGLLGTCHFDLGFYAPWHHELARHLESDAVVLIDPSAALVDPSLIDSLVKQAELHPSLELSFTPAAPGLGGVLLRPQLLDRLASARTHPGRVMHYHPDQVNREMLASDHCAPVPTLVARTTHRFTLDSDRQLQRIGAATDALNGQLMSSGSEELVSRSHLCGIADDLPREIVLELNTTRSTRPFFWPGRHLKIERPNLSLEQAKRLLDELAGYDDLRITIGGVGDPLLHPELLGVIETARQEAGAAIHVETDLHETTDEGIVQLVASQVDIVSVHLPALAPSTYAKLMGVDGYTTVLENIRQFVTERQARGTEIPLLVPVFTKCQHNLAEMEPWYDEWLRALGTAVIRGPSDCARQIPDVSVADMSPPGRRPCARITSRMTILSDGSIVSCDEDVLGKQVMGRVGADSIRDVWRRRFESLRKDHRAGAWSKHALCATCREWHRG